MGNEKEVLEDIMLFLPPRSPEWNPIELAWAIFVRRLQTSIVQAHEIYGTNASANGVAADILRVISV